MLNAHNITVSFAGEDLFSGITFKLDAGNRVGLVGKNGAGKSTLLKIIAKEQEYDKGTLALEKNIKIGFLKQDIDFVMGRTVLEEAYEAFTEIKDVESKLDRVNIALAERTDYESESYHQLMVDLNDLTHHFELIGGYNYKGNTEKILQGLGFKREDFNSLTDKQQ
jgi:ATP-binding cassette subfamily F protein 3